MKKVLCLGLILSFTVFVFAQRESMIPKNLREMSKQVKKPVMIHDLGAFENTVNPTVSSKAALESQEPIGTTYYDLQTNQTVGSSRIHVFDDGTISAVWTMGFVDPWNDRGTGYNYFDGTSWGDAPTARIETVKTGWPNIAPYGPNGEINVAHTGVAQGLYFSHRPTKGTGAWESFFLTGPDATNVLVWPRMITAGENHDVIHVICPGGNATTYEQQTPALLYSRSTDGIEWNPQNIILPGTGFEYYTGINADQYCWAEPVNGILAFVVTDPFIDWFIMKSTDGGDNWEKIMIWEHPYPLMNFETTIFEDTLWAPDGGGDIAIDNTGKIHVVSGLTRVARFADTPSGQYSYWPISEGVCYWNEDMPPFTYEDPHDALDPYDVLEEDVNVIGWLQDVDGDGTITFAGDPSDPNVMNYRSLSLTTMTTMTIDDDNSIYVAWAGETEGYVGTVGSDPYNYKHIWTRVNHFGEWGDFYDLNTDLAQAFDECIYPVYAKGTNQSRHMIYNIDFTPGLGLDEDHPFQENKTQYWTDFLTAIDKNKDNNSKVEVSSCYPNPANDVTYVDVKLKETTTLRLEVTNMIGQVVYEINKGKVNAGTQVLKLDVSGLIPGVYFYTVYADKASVTHKMVIE